MATIDRSADLEPQARTPIGWDGQTLAEMLQSSERRFAETGCYQGLT